MVHPHSTTQILGSGHAQVKHNQVKCEPTGSSAHCCAHQAMSEPWEISPAQEFLWARGPEAATAPGHIWVVQSVQETEGEGGRLDVEEP